MILGIDDGTTAVKVALFDEELREVASARRAVPTSNPAPGRVEQDGEAVLEAVVDAVAEVLPAAEGRPIQGVGLDHQGESVLAWDAATGAPRSPIVVWQDKRGSEAYDAVDPELLARTGLPPDPYFSAPKLSWLVRELGVGEGGGAASGGVGGDGGGGGVAGGGAGAGGDGGVRLGTVDAFLCDRLGAGSGTDASTASRTALQALGAPGAWDPELCAAFGVPVGALPRIAPTAGALGVLRHPRWGDVALPLRARVCDQQAALAGAGCVRAGLTKATYGTGVFVLAHGGEAVPRAEGLLPTVAWAASGRVEYALDGGVFTAGALLEWLSGTLGLAADPIALDALAGSVEGADGVRVLPALAGAGAPWWRSEARAMIAGLTAAATPAHVAYAAFEAIAHRVCDILDASPEPVGVLRVDGGLTNSDRLCQLQADLAQVPVERGTPDATVTGAAGLALVGAGLLPDTMALEHLAPTTARFEPRLPPREAAAARAAWHTFASAALNLPT